MSTQPDRAAKHYGSQLHRSLHQAVAHRIAQEYPSIGGPRTVGLCATVVLEAVWAHLRPREHLSHGQVLWMAVSAKHRPARHQRIVDTPMVPVVLDLSTAEDVQALLDHLPLRQLLLRRILRLCQQAHDQGGLLSNCDLALLLSCDDQKVSTLLAAHERETGKVVPRRATLQDVGSALTHKAIICRKHFADGKTADVVARETYHSLTAVDRYLGQYARVRQCRLNGMTPAQTAHLLQCSEALVNEYLAIERDLTGSQPPAAPDPDPAPVQENPQP